MLYKKKIFIDDSIDSTLLFGVENVHLKTLSNTFPESRISFRGNQVLIQGKQENIKQINDILYKMIEHCQKIGTLTSREVGQYIQIKDFAPNQRHQENQKVILYTAKAQPIQPKTQNQERLINAIQNHDMTFALGPAGSGKTFLSVAAALYALKNKQVKKIIITRPIIEAGEHLGFLPGDLREKINPYLRPIYDALYYMLSTEKVHYYLERDIIEIAPLAYMRGRTLNNAFILLDEGQNTTPLQMKMLLTRIGLNAKLVVTGDLTQVDLPDQAESGLRQALEVVQAIEGIAITQLETLDIQRHPLVNAIIQKYEQIS